MHLLFEEDFLFHQKDDITWQLWLWEGWTYNGASVSLYSTLFNVPIQSSGIEIPHTRVVSDEAWLAGIRYGRIYFDSRIFLTLGYSDS